MTSELSRTQPIQRSFVRHLALPGLTIGFNSGASLPNVGVRRPAEATQVAVGEHDTPQRGFAPRSGKAVLPFLPPCTRKWLRVVVMVA